MLVDSHVHVACGDRARYPVHPTGVGRDWWTSAGGGGPALLAAMDAAGVDAAVVVQAVGPYGYDCRCAADATAVDPDRLALVVAVDMAGEDPAEALAAVTARWPVAGVRLFGVGRADPPEPRWLADGRAAAVWEVAEEQGLTVVPTLFASALGALRPLVERQPGVAVAIDHAGFPDLPLQPGAPVLRLADLPAVHLKVSSHLLHASQPPEAVVDALAGAFGPDRLCWGSDFPQTEGDYADLVALGRRVAPSEGFLGLTARALWWPAG